MFNNSISNKFNKWQLKKIAIRSGSYNFPGVKVGPARGSNVFTYK